MTQSESMGSGFTGPMDNGRGGFVAISARAPGHSENGRPRARVSGSGIAGEGGAVSSAAGGAYGRKRPGDQQQQQQRQVRQQQQHDQDQVSSHGAGSGSEAGGKGRGGGGGGAGRAAAAATAAAAAVRSPA